MPKLLIQFEANWADEIDIVGFHIITTQAWEFFQKTLTEADFPLTIGIGSNQEIKFDTPTKFWGAFQTREASGIELMSLEPHFPKLPFGQFPMEQILQGLIEDEPERGIQDEPWLMEEIMPYYIL